MDETEATTEENSTATQRRLTGLEGTNLNDRMKNFLKPQADAEKKVEPWSTTGNPATSRLALLKQKLNFAAINESDNNVINKPCMKKIFVSDQLQKIEPENYAVLENLETNENIIQNISNVESTDYPLSSFLKYMLLTPHDDLVDFELEKFNQENVENDDEDDILNQISSRIGNNDKASQVLELNQNDGSIRDEEINFNKPDSHSNRKHKSSINLMDDKSIDQNVKLLNEFVKDAGADLPAVIMSDNKKLSDIRNSFNKSCKKTSKSSHRSKSNRPSHRQSKSGDCSTSLSNCVKESRSSNKRGVNQYESNCRVKRSTKIQSNDALHKASYDIKNNTHDHSLSRKKKNIVSKNEESKCKANIPVRSKSEKNIRVILENNSNHTYCELENFEKKVSNPKKNHTSQLKSKSLHKINLKNDLIRNKFAESTNCGISDKSKFKSNKKSHDNVVFSNREVKIKQSPIFLRMLKDNGIIKTANYRLTENRRLRQSDSIKPMVIGNVIRFNNDSRNINSTSLTSNPTVLNRFRDAPSSLNNLNKIVRKKILISKVVNEIHKDSLDSTFEKPTILKNTLNNSPERNNKNVKLNLIKQFGDFDYKKKLINMKKSSKTVIADSEEFQPSENTRHGSNSTIDDNASVESDMIEKSNVLVDTFFNDEQSDENQPHSDD